MQMSASHTHNHDHPHGHVHALTAAPAQPGLSLLRLSVPARLGFAGVLLALLWAATLAVIG
jgi:hypothetical protein